MRASNESSKLININSASRILGMSPQSIYSSLKHGPLRETLKVVKRDTYNLFREADVLAARDVLLGAPEKKTPDPQPDWQEITIADAARVLEMPIHQAREALALHGVTLNLTDVCALQDRLARLCEFARGLVVVGETMKVKAEEAVSINGSKVVVELPPKVKDEAILIGGQRWFNYAGLARQCDVDHKLISEAAAKLNLVTTDVGNSKLLSEAQAELVRKCVREMAAARPAPVETPRGVGDGWGPQLLVEQRRTNELLEKLLAAWAGKA